MDKDKASNNPDELKALLEELSETEPLSKKGSKSGGGKKKEVIEVPPTPRRPKPAPMLSMLLEEEKADVSIVKAEPENLPEIFNKQFTQIFKQYNHIFNDIIENYQHDRVQAQEVIDAFMGVIMNGGKVPRIYLEKVADAVRVKNEIAQTAIKALESIPKLMSASKGNEVFNQVNMSFDASQLAELLKTEQYDDETEK